MGSKEGRMNGGMQFATWMLDTLNTHEAEQKGLCANSFNELHAFYTTGFLRSYPVQEQKFIYLFYAKICRSVCVFIWNFKHSNPCLIMCTFCKDQLELCVLSAWVLIASHLSLVTMLSTLSRHEATDDTANTLTPKTLLTTMYSDCC